MSQGRCRYESGQRGMDDLRYGLCMYESGQLQNLSPHPPGLTPTGRPGSPPSTCFCFLCLTGSGRQPTRWPPVPRPERLTTSTTLREEEGQEQQQRIPCLAGFRSVPGNPDLSQGQRTPPLPPSGLPLSRMRLLFLTAPHLSAGASGLCPQPVLGPCRVPRCPGRNGGLSLPACLQVHPDFAHNLSRGHAGYRGALDAMVAATRDFDGQLFYQTTVPAHFSAGELAVASCASHKGKGPAVLAASCASH